VATLRRPPWTRIAIAAPGLAAAVVALVGLVNGPSSATRPQAPAALARPVPAPLPPRPGRPAPLVAGPGAEVGVPARFAGRGAFLTVQDRVARLGPAPGGQRAVALTFDDGPGPMTGAFLDRLEHLHAKATFFVVGYAVKARPDLLRRIAAAGMGIGNHSFAHPPMAALSPRDQRFQITADQDAIARVVGYRPLFFRPPYRSMNRVTAREIAAAGMVGALWTVDTRDWTRPGVRTIVQRALQVQPGGVIELHDFGGDRRQTLAALEKIVRGLRERHLEPVTLDRLYRPPAAAAHPGPLTAPGAR
jgi:peptidoglycan/xylan/chitin deacetylase (PgdA/CDA1 family)